MINVGTKSLPHDHKIQVLDELHQKGQLHYEDTWSRIRDGERAQHSGAHSLNVCYRHNEQNYPREMGDR